MTYTPSLDGLRGISIALVLLTHAGLEKIVPGGLGVTIFFAISGFLLTGQMADEIMATGRMDVPLFYLRRVLRLMPTLFAYILAVSWIMGALGQRVAPLELFTALAYLSNYYALYHGFDFKAFHILWSLAVEEHFYLVAPLVMVLCRRHLRTLIPAIIGVMAFELVWRTHVHGACPGSFALCGTGALDRVYYGTDTRVDSILFGSLAALMVRFDLARPFIGRWAIAIAGAWLLASLAIRAPWWRDTLRYTVQGGAIAVIILNVACARSMVSVALAWRPLVFLGKISYALYLVHYGTLIVLDRAFGHVPMLAYLAISLGLATLTYFAIEVPMQGVRKRFRTGASASRQPSVATHDAGPVASSAPLAPH